MTDKMAEGKGGGRAEEQGPAGSPEDRRAGRGMDAGKLGWRRDLGLGWGGGTEGMGGSEG